METVLQINKSPSNVFWVSYKGLRCEKCGGIMVYECHSRERTLIIDGKEERIINCYYKCFSSSCDNKKPVVAKHPEIIYKKQHSRSTFARVIYLKYIKQFSVKQILDDLSYLKEGTCYEIIKTYRAAARVRADERIAQKFPSGTKIRVSIDAMEPEKGQPPLYTVRETKEGELLAARFLEDSSGDAIYELLKEIEKKYGIEYAGFVSDKEKGIVAMHDKYYPDVPHQYCVVHFLNNVTKGLRELDKRLQKNLRSEVRTISTFKTVKKKVLTQAPDLAENERTVLSDTRAALLAVVNQKKKEKFDLVGIAIFANLSDAVDWLCEIKNQSIYLKASRKFQILLSHLVEKLQDILREYRNINKLIVLANHYIHPIFAAVTKPHPKHPKRDFNHVIRSWENVLTQKGISKKMRGLLSKALNFAHSYERGLFLWRKAKLPKTNNGTEIFYHEKKGNYRRNSPNMKIGTTLTLTAPEEMYIPKKLTEKEILLSLDLVGSEDYWRIREEMEARSARRAFNKHCRKDIKGVLAEIFKRLENK